MSPAITNENYRTVVVEQENVVIVQATGTGPQGPAGSAGPTGPAGPAGPPGTLNFNDSAKVDGSVIYYDAASSQFKADTVWTTGSLTDGGNF